MAHAPETERLSGIASAHRRDPADLFAVQPANARPMEGFVKKHTTEADARIVVDEHLRQAGWNPADKSQVSTEWQIVRDTSVKYRCGENDSLEPEGHDKNEAADRRADYVLLNGRGHPLAVIEAKRAAIEPYTAKQ